MFDISVLVCTHKRIKTTSWLLESIQRNSSANVQVVIIGDRSHVESVDVPGMSVNEYFGTRKDIVTVKSLDESRGKKCVFVECQTTKKYSAEKMEYRWDWPKLYMLHYAASYGVQFCDSDLILGPTEDDMYFIRHWDEEFLCAVKEYNPDKYVFVHQQSDVNQLPTEYRPHISDPTLVSYQSGDMMNTPELGMDLLDRFCECFYESVKHQRKVMPVKAQITELAPLLIKKSIINKMGGYHNAPVIFNGIEERNVSNSCEVLTKLNDSGIGSKVQTGAVLFHNYYKQRML